MLRSGNGGSRTLADVASVQRGPVRRALSEQQNSRSVTLPTNGGHAESAALLLYKIPAIRSAPSASTTVKIARIARTGARCVIDAPR